MSPRFDLRPLLAPRSIAVVGASESPDSWAPEIERSLRHVGYDGALYPINPKYETVWGRPCLASIGELPVGVDLVVFVVPARVVVGMIDACGERGVRGIMVVSSGFAEMGDEGRELQERLREAALRTRIPLLGPNVEGFVNYVDHAAPYGTTPPPVPLPGSISVISQSGTVAWTMNQLASDRAVGLRIILGVGNEAVLGLGDLFEWAAGDRHTRIVTSYLETMRDVEGIGSGLDALRGAGKPVVICAPPGRSDAARRSIVAHTGALAGNTVLRDAWLRARGVVLVEDPVTMFEAAVLLSQVRTLRAPGVAAALQSGGACTLFAEAAGAAGLSMPAFAPATRRALRRALPAFASQNNPLDVTGQAAVETSMFEGALEALASDPAIGLIAFDAFPPRLPGETPWADPVLRTVDELRRRTGVAFASVAMSPLAYSPEAARFVRRWKRLPFLQGHRAAAGAIRGLIEQRAARGWAPADLRPHPQRAAARRLLRGRRGPVDESVAADLLQRYGVRRPREAIARDPSEAAAAAKRIGFPVAIKALAPEVPHKAKLGGVRLGIDDAGAAEAAAADVLRSARRAGARAPRVLVQRMATGIEVLVGAVVDERFGPMITMRPGGALAEAGDAVFVPCPLTPSQARRFVAEQAAACCLDPERDAISAVARAVEAIGRAASDLRDRLTSLEANPLLVDERYAIAVDALAEARER
jgi:acetate---CoA ligase (ADP-forming)